MLIWFLLLIKMVGYYFCAPVKTVLFVLQR